LNYFSQLIFHLQLVGDELNQTAAAAAAIEEQETIGQVSPSSHPKSNIYLIGLMKLCCAAYSYRNLNVMKLIAVSK